MPAICASLKGKYHNFFLNKLAAIILRIINHSTRIKKNRIAQQKNTKKSPTTHSHVPSARQLYGQILAEELVRSQSVDRRMVVVVLHEDDPLLEGVYDGPAALRGVRGANPAALVVPLALQGEREVAVHYQLAALLGQGVFDLT